jgi:signal transduction histidine kinase
MSFKKYIKERWYLYLLLSISFGFAFSVYMLDERLKTNKNVDYIFWGMLFVFIVFVVLDYFTVKNRMKTLSSFIQNGGTEDIELYYPVDNKYVYAINELAKKFNKYRADIASDSADEIDFITKWVHDVKVPISAIKLLLDSDEIDKNRLEMELSAVEQNTQKVLFHIKSKSFYDDYKVKEIWTRELIVPSLKKYATFFAYKRISLNFGSDSYKVLTDDKWSGYIISQLLSNAVKHTSYDGSIEINTMDMGNQVRICIKNYGKGIKTCDLLNIFNKGYSSDAVRNGSPSTGYGLYLSKQLADKLGHELYAKSKYGEYAEFCLVINKSESTI